MNTYGCGLRPIYPPPEFSGNVESEIKSLLFTEGGGLSRDKDKQVQIKPAP